MYQYVCVRMSQQTLIVGDLHAAQNHLAPLCQLMYVISVSDSQFHACSSCCFKIACAISASSGVVILMLV